MSADGSDRPRSPGLRRRGRRARAQAVRLVALSTLLGVVVVAAALLLIGLLLAPAQTVLLLLLMPVLGGPVLAVTRWLRGRRSAVRGTAVADEAARWLSQQSRPTEGS